MCDVLVYVLKAWTQKQDSSLTTALSSSGHSLLSSAATSIIINKLEIGFKSICIDRCLANFRTLRGVNLAA